MSARTAVQQPSKEYGNKTWAVTKLREYDVWKMEISRQRRQLAVLSRYHRYAANHCAVGAMEEAIDLTRLVIATVDAPTPPATVDMRGRFGDRRSDHEGEWVSLTL